MKAYYAETDPAKQGEIAVLQMHALRDHWKGKLGLNDVLAMFSDMREHMLTSKTSVDGASLCFNAEHKGDDIWAPT
ncbi:hypothetical protein SSBR45G_56180 [Bradyrhizobium sp. SSBR45G]|uniref:hypothetical protein n=1 Tax=unclassified Bradyrhizobium TaxID=2631580 RepID=UPI002342B98D|nr:MULTISPECIES: hypothetical protein [unclassified Bradyrhizobium]GLH80709.1 hypothetical protein SSBR45G_56180 [Bradyrhizobium sp. SSBR45G]GLH88098.1 hypothetical protein SSBR45R_55590 [Bradyrhizobium sp. SSBR45R]